MPPRRGIGPRLDRIRADLRDAQAQASSAALGTTAPTPPSSSSPTGRLPGESQDDYIYRTVFGGAEADPGPELPRQRAGRAATAARYGESGSDFVSPWQSPASSRVRAYQWDSAQQQLRVRFIKYETPWVYNNVDLAVFQAFDAADSKGKFINRVLNNYEHRRATDVEEAIHFQGV
jgi:hypothetical protein